MDDVEEAPLTMHVQHTRPDANRENAVYRKPAIPERGKSIVIQTAGNDGPAHVHA